ncbi:hypothetical protein DV515_00019266, partial [Chloebia gouldiae]
QDIKGTFIRCENIKFQEPELVPVDVGKKFRNCFLQDVVMRKMEKVFSKVPQADVTLDPSTAHPRLSLSPDRRSVRLSERRPELSGGSRRSDGDLCVLGAPGFSAGRHYWEVEVGGRRGWAVGAARERRRHKGVAAPGREIWAVGTGGKKFQGLTVTEPTASGELTVLVPDEWPGLAPNERPGLAPDEWPGLAPNERPGLAPDERPGLAPNERPGLAPDEWPGLAPDGWPGLAPDERPGLAPNERPGLAPNGRTGLAPDGRPGLAPNERPGLAPDERPVSAPGERPRRFGVYLDYERGQLGFYDAESMRHIHTFHIRCRERVFPFFRVLAKGTRIKICT